MLVFHLHVYNRFLEMQLILMKLKHEILKTSKAKMEFFDTKVAHFSYDIRE